MYDGTIHQFIRDYLGVDGLRLSDLQRCKPDEFGSLIFEHCREFAATSDSPNPVECRLRMSEYSMDSDSNHLLQKG